MSTIDRRKLLHAGIAMAVPFGTLALLGGCAKQPDESTGKKPESDDDPNPAAEKSNPTETPEGTTMQIKYLEIVTPDVDALCKQYSATHGVTFRDPDAALGNARTADLEAGGLLGIRAPMRPDETPVVRPYVLVDDVEKAVAAASEAGAEVAIPKMEIPGHGTIAIVIHGGIECGFWQ